MDVSVVIPTFDRPQLLRRAINSALHQEKLPCEILVVNDGPTPVQIPENPPIPVRLLETAKRQGPTVARMLAIDNLSPNSNAICYLDDDDELLRNHVSALSKALDSGAPFAFSKAIYSYPNGFQTEDPEPNNHGPKRYYDPSALLKQNIAPISSFMHTREAYTEIGGWDPSLLRMEDWDFWGRMFIHYGPPAFVNEPTNVIYKGLGDNRTDSNQYVYSMSCSWRDIVDDRLKTMAAEKRAKVNESDLKRLHIPTVGIVMPFYNAIKHMREAIESMLRQTYKDFELIGINDGSNDASRQLFIDYMSTDNRLRLFDMPKNSGVTKALNFGLLVSRSKYIARMDADDVSEPDRLRQQVEFLDNNRDVMVVGTNFLSMNEDLSALIWKNELPTDPAEVAKQMLDGCCIGHPTVMMRRQIIEIVGGYDESEEYKAVEDYELWLRISRNHKIANIPSMLLRYRSHENQVSNLLLSTQNVNARKVRQKYKLMSSTNV